MRPGLLPAHYFEHTSCSKLVNEYKITNVPVKCLLHYINCALLPNKALKECLHQCILLGPFSGPNTFVFYTFLMQSSPSPILAQDGHQGGPLIARWGHTWWGGDSVLQLSQPTFFPLSFQAPLYRKFRRNMFLTFAVHSKCNICLDHIIILDELSQQFM